MNEQLMEEISFLRYTTRRKYRATPPVKVLFQQRNPGMIHVFKPSTQEFFSRKCVYLTVNGKPYSQLGLDMEQYDVVQNVISPHLRCIERNVKCNGENCWLQNSEREQQRELGIVIDHLPGGIVKTKLKWINLEENLEDDPER